jgi:hypothetical protein
VIAATAPPRWVQLAVKQLKQMHPKQWDSARYRREEFGSGWKVVQGCDTRNAILKRDLADVVTRKVGKCKTEVSSGTLHDPYTGQTIYFADARTLAKGVPIDHIVALKNAWKTGADRWPRSLRIQFYNDDAELLAVSAGPNSKKRDDDASAWLPINDAYRCRYVAKQIEIKARYGLWVTAGERQRMAAVLAHARC